MVMEHAKRMVLANALMDSTEIPVQVNIYHLPPIYLHLIFTACVACKIQVQTKQKAEFIKVDFSNNIYLLEQESP